MPSVLARSGWRESRAAEKTDMCWALQSAGLCKWTANRSREVDELGQG